MSGNDPFSKIPRTTHDLIAQMNPDDPQLHIDLNRIQSSMISELLRKGQVTPQQVDEWRNGTGTMPTVLPEKIDVALTSLAEGTLGGRTDKEDARMTEVVIPAHESTQAQRKAHGRKRVPAISPG